MKNFENQNLKKQCKFFNYNILPIVVMNTRKPGSLGLAAGSVKTTTSPTSASTASPSASAASFATAAAPGVLGAVAEALELLGVVGGGPCLDGILGGV